MDIGVMFLLGLCAILLFTGVAVLLVESFKWTPPPPPPKKPYVPYPPGVPRGIEGSQYALSVPVIVAAFL
ncbi:hypothetical protein D3C78_1713450 [compost metagenome]